MSAALGCTRLAIGIDIGKTTFHLIGQDRRGAHAPRSSSDRLDQSDPRFSPKSAASSWVQRTSPLRKASPAINDPPKHFSPRVLRLIMSLIEELNTLEARIASLSDEIEAWAAEDEPCQRLRPCRASASSSRAPSSR